MCLNSPFTSAGELESILAAPYPCGTNPCIEAAFGPTQSYKYRSATNAAGFPFLWWSINFSDGGAGPRLETLCPCRPGRRLSGQLMIGDLDPLIAAPGRNLEIFKFFNFSRNRAMAQTDIALARVALHEEASTSKASSTSPMRSFSTRGGYG